MPVELYKQIHAQNEAFMCLNLHYDYEYFQFLSDLFCQFQETFSSLSASSSAEHLYTDRGDSDTKFHKAMFELTSKYTFDSEGPNIYAYANEYENIVKEYGQEMNEVMPENMLVETDFA